MVNGNEQNENNEQNIENQNNEQNVGDDAKIDLTKFIEFPEKDATPEQLAAVYKRMGAIEKVEDLNDIAKDDALFDSVKESIVAAKLTKTQAKTIYEGFVGKLNAQIEAAKAENTKSFEELKTKEWGKDFDSKIVNIKDNIAKLKIDANTVKFIEANLGSAAMLRMFDAIFAAAKDGDIKEQNAGGGKNNIVPTDKVEAQKKLNELMASTEFMGKIAAGDEEASKTFNELHAVIYK